MAGVLPSGLPAFSSYTQIDPIDDSVLIYDASTQQLKRYQAELVTFPYTQGGLFNQILVNSEVDLPTPVAGIITLSPNTIYRIGDLLDIGANTLKMSNGTAILGDSAQAAGIISSAPITIDTTSSAFSTFNIKGPLRIENTNATGKCVNVQSGGFLIYSGAICYASLAAQYGIYCMSGAAALAVSNYTMIGAGTKLYAQGLSFGGTFTGLQSNSLTGDGLIFDGVSGTTVYGDMIFNDCLINCTGATGTAFKIVGKSSTNSAIRFNSCSFKTANGTAGYFESTAANKFYTIQATQTDFRNTSGGIAQFGLNLNNCYFDFGSFSYGYITTAGTGASYAAIADIAKIGVLLSFSNIYFNNSTTPANVTSGFTEKSLRISVEKCYNLVESSVTGNLYVSAATGTFPATGVNSEIASASINAVDGSSNLERTSTVVSDTAYRLKYIGTQASKASASYTVSYSQSTAATVTCTFELWGSTLGLISGSTTATTLTTTGITATTSVTIPVNLPVNEELFLKVVSSGTPTLTFKTLTISVS
jgi:hypothetical protein